MRKLSGILLLLAVVGCESASIPLASPQADTQAKAFPAPPPGQASLYVFREGTFNSGFLIGASVGQRTLGQLGAETWFLVDVTPGSHDVRCVTPESNEAVTVTAAAGETRFVQITARIGWSGPKCVIAEVAPAHGREVVLRGKRAREIR